MLDISTSRLHQVISSSYTFPGKEIYQCIQIRSMLTKSPCDRFPVNIQVPTRSRKRPRQTTMAASGLAEEIIGTIGAVLSTHREIA